MNCGPKIVEKAGEGERKSARGAARLGLGLEDLNVQACGGEDNGRGEAVGTGADDGGAVWQISRAESQRFRLDRTVIASLALSLNL